MFNVAFLEIRIYAMILSVVDILSKKWIMNKHKDEMKYFLDENDSWIFLFSHPTKISSLFQNTEK